MRKDHIRGNITMFQPDITATFERDLEYILGETNSECLVLFLFSRFQLYRYKLPWLTRYEKRP